MCRPAADIAPESGATEAVADHEDEGGPPTYRPPRIYWGLGDDEILLPAEELRELLDDDRLDTDRKLADGFFDLCWHTKYGAPYPPAWWRRLDDAQDAAGDHLIDWVHENWQNHETRREIFDLIDRWEWDWEERVADEDWVLVFDEDTCEGVELQAMRNKLQRPATALGRHENERDANWESSRERDSFEEGCPPLRVTLNLPEDALRHHLRCLHHGIGFYISYSLYLSRNHVLLLLAHELVEQDVTAHDVSGQQYEVGKVDRVQRQACKVGHEKAKEFVLQSLPLIREGVAAAMAILAGDFAEQVAEEARWDREGTRARADNRMGLLAFACSFFFFCEGVAHVEPRITQTGMTPFPFNHHRQREKTVTCPQMQESMGAITQIVREQVQTVLVRLARIGFSSRGLSAAPYGEDPRNCAEYGAVSAGFKQLAVALLQREDVRARRPQGFDERALQEWSELEEVTPEQKERGTLLQGLLMKSLEGK